ncbi:MAG: DUF4351 domain-containing protein [Thiocapsa sp.]|uniref:DUF4351 domain-containing protein n=1 Tax=Thiocapsa sp. TaxID=2024551 RepID=UPI001BD16ED1|nr:DUF4351 domain-containing protein [Thiocapsa sp.]QVL46972.1 MAG: DUF4351 domain-containing protein [Thiocapsa sp.]
MSTAAARDDFDNPWKEMLEHAFPELMAFYFPDAHARIDWSREHVFLNTELRKIVRDAESGKRIADALVRVTLLDGTEQWVYLHLEVQGQHDSDFAQRMFIYNYRLYDRYSRPIASLAVLADLDAGWKPDRFDLEQLGCSHRFRFPVVKLLDYADRLAALETDANPFALITAAHLYTARTRHDPKARYGFKRRLVRLLYRHGWDRQRILDLFAVIDWMMRLPDALEQALWKEIQSIEGERKMAYVTSVERLAVQRGLQEGEAKGRVEGEARGEVKGRVELLARLLTKRFGPLSPEIQARLTQATSDQLERWGERLLDADSLEGVFDDH